MRSFARIRERIDDVRMSKPLLVGVVKLLLVTMIILNILGGAWCVLFLTFMQGCCSGARAVAWRAVVSLRVLLPLCGAPRVLCVTRAPSNTGMRTCFPGLHPRGSFSGAQAAGDRATS
jgi:hypothetical protein